MPLIASVEGESNVHRRRWIWVGSVLVSIVALSALSLLVDWEVFAATIVQTRPGALLAALGTTFLTLWLRARRLRTLLDVGQCNHEASVEPGAYLRTTSLHHLVFISCPSALGDIALPLIARMHLGRSLVDTAAVLFLGRVQDLVVVIGMGVGAIFWKAGSGPINIVGLFLIAAVVLFLLAKTGSFINANLRILGRISAKSGLWKNLQRRLGPATSRARSILTDGPHLRAGFWTLLSWLAAAASLFFVFHAYNVVLTFDQTALLLFGLNVVGALAVFSIAGLGVVEAGLVGLLILLGWSGSAAAPLAVAVRLTLLIANMVVPAAIEGGTIAWTAVQRFAKPKP